MNGAFRSCNPEISPFTEGMEEILRSIPHRPPFLFIDTIEEIREDGATCTRTIRAEEPQFEGHYPGNPIMPGVLLCEALEHDLRFLIDKAQQLM